MRKELAIRGLSLWQPGARLIAAAVLCSLAVPHPARAQAQPFDLVLRNAQIVDGSGKPAYRGDTIARIADRKSVV